MSRISFRSVKLLAVVLLPFATSALWAASSGTYVVGTCKPGFPTYATISQALAATPAPQVVVVCPGTYNEQVEISQPVTLEGISTGNSDQVIIGVPSGGLVANATDDFGPAAAQVWVNNTAGPVTISNITVDAAGNGSPSGAVVVGIFFQNSSGTVNRVTARNQFGLSGEVGIYLEGGASNPSITVENSNIHDFNGIGVFIETNLGALALSATLKGNNINSNTDPLSPSAPECVEVDGATASVTNNVVTGGFYGITAFDTASGSISDNTLINNEVGMWEFADGMSVTGNKILNSVLDGILVSSSVSSIQNNLISNAPRGINFECVAGTNVHANTVSEAGTGLANVPATSSTANSYFNVGTIRSDCD